MKSFIKICLLPCLLAAFVLGDYAKGQFSGDRYYSSNITRGNNSGVWRAVYDYENQKWFWNPEKLTAPTGRNQPIPSNRLLPRTPPQSQTSPQPQVQRQVLPQDGSVRTEPENPAVVWSNWRRGDRKIQAIIQEERGWEKIRAVQYRVSNDGRYQIKYQFQSFNNRFFDDEIEVCINPDGSITESQESPQQQFQPPSNNFGNTRGGSGNGQRVFQLQPGDVILVINGESITGRESLTNAVRRSPQTMRFTVRDGRSGAILHFVTTLNSSGYRFGITQKDNPGGGAKVVSVDRNSPATNCILVE